MVSLGKILLDGRGALHLNLVDSVLLDHGAVVLEDDQAGDTANLELLGEGGQAGITLGEGEPGHLTVVLVILLLSLVAGAEDDLNDLTVLVDLTIEISEDWGELSARRAIVHTEVDTNQFCTLEAIGRAHCALLGDDRGSSK